MAFFLFVWIIYSIIITLFYFEEMGDRKFFEGKVKCEREYYESVIRMNRELYRKCQDEVAVMDRNFADVNAQLSGYKASLAKAKTEILEEFELRVKATDVLERVRSVIDGGDIR